MHTMTIAAGCGLQIPFRESNEMDAVLDTLEKFRGNPGQLQDILISQVAAETDLRLVRPTHR